MGVDLGFKGSIPALYERFGVPMLFGPYAEDLAARLHGLVEGCILETAAGTGILTRAMLHALPETVRIIATDLSQPMLEHAARQVVSGRVIWQQADAQALPFADGSFDAVVCQFGVMFFPDKLRGFTEARRVLRLGGRYMFSVWDRLERNALAHTVMQALAAIFPDDPPTFMQRTPHGHYDVGVLAQTLRAAGFTAIASETVARSSISPDARAVAAFYCCGSPMSAEIEARAPGRLDEIAEAVAAAIRERYGLGEVTAPMQAIIFSAMR